MAEKEKRARVAKSAKEPKLAKAAKAAKAAKLADTALTGHMRAHVLHYSEGLTDIERVHAIRISDPRYNLLIMDDYAPVIGMVQGAVSILSDENELVMDGIKGFYRLLKDDFTLLIQPGGADERAAVGAPPRGGASQKAEAGKAETGKAETGKTETGAETGKAGTETERTVAP